MAINKRWYALFLVPALIAAGTSAQELIRKRYDSVDVSISWEYKNIPAEIELYEVEGNPPLWETKSVENLSSAPVGQKIPGSRLEMRPDSNRVVVLVMQNNTKKPLYFFAAPHQVNPAEYSLGFKFHCLCINHTFEVKPGQTWYRVVKLELYPGYQGNRLNVVHQIISLDQPVNVFMKHHDM